jgi:hypothetical protein
MIVDTLVWMAAVLIIWTCIATPIAIITGRSARIADEHAARQHDADLRRVSEVAR